MAELAKRYPVDVRFIEMMPIGQGKQFTPKKEKGLLEELQLRYGKCEACEEELGNGPGHYYSFPGFAGKIGFISRSAISSVEAATGSGSQPRGF